jgi:hypothetical protein
VTDEGVPNDDMPNFLRPAARDGLPFSDAALAALLAGAEPPEPMPGLQPVADLLAALRSGPTGDELAGEASVLAEFRRGAGVVAQAPAPHRPRRVTSLVSARAAVAAAVAALSLGGLATAAYAGMLPAPVQRFAHDTIGAPAAPSSSPAKTHLARNRTPVLPGATSPKAHRLCTAYTFAKAHGTAAQRAAAFHNLIGAAGGAGKVAAFCGTVAHPGRSGAHSGKGASNGNHGKGGSNGNHGKGSSNGNHGKGSSQGNHGKSASNSNQGNGSSNGNHGKGGSNGNQGKGSSNGNHGKGSSQGNHGQRVPSGQQNRHRVPNSKGKSSAHGGGNRGKQGAPHASGKGAHKPLHATERSPRARR